MNDLYNRTLVSFGNFMLKQYGNKKDIHGNDATVSDADVSNWRHSLGDDIQDALRNTTSELTLPSAHQVNDIVRVDFGVGMVNTEATVTGVYFTESSVYYDLELNFQDNDNGVTGYSVPLYKIHASFVEAIK